MVSKDSDENATPRRRPGGRVVLSLDVKPEIREALREKAADAGVSMAEYVANAIAKPERTYRTAAGEIAEPLVRVSAALSRLRRTLVSLGDDSAIAQVDAAMRVVADALRPLARQHDAQVRANEVQRRERRP